MRFIFKIIFVFIFGFSLGIIFTFASKNILNYIPKIARVLSRDKLDEVIQKTSKKDFYGKIKKEKIGQYIQFLRKKGYKNYYSSFLLYSGMFLDYSNNKREDYFIGKEYKEIKRQEWEALAFYLGLKKQYSNKTISIQEHFKHKIQKLSLSCEANTLTDFINYYRLEFGLPIVNEYRLIAQIPKDDQQVEIKDGKYYRGDPEVGFVGNMNGYAFRKDNKYIYKWGWGVYPKPLLKILNYYFFKFNLKAVEKNKITDLDIISSLSMKRPIMMWYIFDGSNIPLNIITSTNKEMILYKNQHVGLIVGVKLDNNMNIIGLYYYDGLHKSKQFMFYNDFIKTTKLMSKFIFVKNN